MPARREAGPADRSGSNPVTRAIRRRQRGGKTYGFLGSERSFEDYVNTRPADLGPEGVRFVPKSDSPTGHALILVTNEISGTVAAIEVRR